ncbi:MAG TPA: DUF4105 domain-containing protein [Candidatus Binatia bacterium]|jgi:hypothetical protein|nr:DUF4105 domain-containing protein [Candidatus Binatia bacterium]
MVWVRRLLLVPVMLLVLAWGFGALHFAGPGGGRVPDVLAWLWVALGLAILVFVRPWGRTLLAFAVALIVLLVWWSTVVPRNDRNWAADVKRLPHGTVQGDILTIENVRDFDYRSETDWTERWETRTYDLSKLEGVDLFLSYWGSPVIAHTIMSWRFSDGQHLAISIELRKEVGEVYTPIAGFFRSYELYYVTADERDVVRLRTNYRGENVYLYPLRMPRVRARKVLLDYVASMNSLVTEPAFYNTIAHNCTTTIRTHVMQIGADWPLDYRLFANGYIGEWLYEKERIDTSRPFAVVRETSSIDGRAKAADQDPAFSARIRDGMVIPPLLPDPP